jgi:hypothetical protein
MYWIYLIIFIFAVLVPDIVPHNTRILFFQEENLEESLIFILGLSGFMIFRFKERQSNLNFREKVKFQKEASQVTKSLNDTYSYIGETNRKLDIMKNISDSLLEISDLSPGKEKKFFDVLMESIYIMVKSKRFIIRFVNTETGTTEMEIKSRRRIFFKINNLEIIKKLEKENKSFTESNYHFIITSPKKIGNIFAAIIISKNNQQQKLEDPDILKALASQSLFLYYFSKKPKELNN